MHALSLSLSLSLSLALSLSHTHTLIYIYIYIYIYNENINSAVSKKLGKTKLKNKPYVLKKYVCTTVYTHECTNINPCMH